MSVFDQNNNQENNLFETLVGEGQKYKSVEDLAKGYAHADAHIATLTKELNELKAQNASNQNITDAVNNRKSEDEAPANSTPADLNSLSKEELLKLVKGVVEEDKTHNTQQNNLSQIDEFLINKYGDKATQEANRIAQENGLDLEGLKQMAATNPQLVMNLCGGANQTVTQTGTFQSNINTASQPETTKGSSYYNTMRREQPNKFYSRAVQNEMRDAIATMGDDFLNN